MSDKHLKNTFIFIPDISGFSRFVNETAIQHSKHIISELLELIIEADELGLTVSEIEGDAVLFYKQEIPKLIKVLDQAEKMFIRFHNHLNRYENNRICRCGACETASKLSLKFVVHQGPVELIKIRDHVKLHGADVILVHRLLKNSIPENEYILITESFQNELTLITEKRKMNSWPQAFKTGSDPMDNQPFEYAYVSMKPLFNKLISPEKLALPETGKNALKIEIKINCTIDKLYEIFSNLNLRKQWSNDIREIFLHDDNLNQAGSMHTCIIDHRPMNIQTIGRDEDDKRISYAERVNRFGYFRNITRIYTFIKHQDHTHLKLEITFELIHPLLSLLKPFFKQILKRFSVRNLNQLKEFCERSGHNSQKI